MGTGEITKEDMRDRLGNLDQIRDLLFGDLMRQYNGRFGKLETEMAEWQRDIQAQIQEVQRGLTAEMRAMADAIEKKLQYLSAAADEEMADIRQQLETSDRKFSSGLAATDKAFKSQQNQLREELLQTRSNLEAELQDLKDRLYAEIEKNFSQLKEGKISKEELSEVLFELCMRVKGGGVESASTPKNAELLLPESQG